MSTNETTVPEKDLAKKKSVDKRGPMSDTAYARSVLRELGNAQNLIVINDEAHHAWRVNVILSDTPVILSAAKNLAHYSYT